MLLEAFSAADRLGSSDRIGIGALLLLGLNAADGVGGRGQQLPACSGGGSRSTDVLRGGGGGALLLTVLSMAGELGFDASA